MYCTNFEYGNRKLSDYNMIIGSLNGSGGNEIVSSGADIVFNQIRPSGSSHFNLYSSTYQEAFISTFQIVKNPCKCQRNYYLTPTEVSNIQRWLCRKGYNKFKILQDGYEDIHWHATFSSKQILSNGKITGLELTLYTDAPYAYHDRVKCPFQVEKNTGTAKSGVEPGHDFTLYDTSDEIGWIYPDVKITMMEPGDFTLINSLDNKLMKINNVISGEVIYIDGRNQIISSSVQDHTICNDFNFYFPRIINTCQNNKNDFTVSLSCNIIFYYSPICKVGI